MKHFNFSFLAALFLFAGGCGVEDPPATSDAPLFEAVYADVLVTAGCAGGYCHGGGAGGMSLGAREDAYAQLVGVRSTNPACGNAVRVVPGNPDESLLWRKLAPGVEVCGAKMPNYAAPLAATQLDLIRNWITGGAH